MVDLINISAAAFRSDSLATSFSWLTGGSNLEIMSLGVNERGSSSPKPSPFIPGLPSSSSSSWPFCIALGRSSCGTKTGADTFNVVFGEFAATKTEGRDLGKNSPDLGLRCEWCLTVSGVGCVLLGEAE